MEIRIGNARLELVQGNIVIQDTGAIVNAANNRLTPGGGVSGAIHRVAGPELWEECKKLGGCLTGEAKLTKGYQLKAQYVIHTVGPVYSGIQADKELLRKAYISCLELAIQNKIESLSFPAISTGIFGYPLEEAAEVSLSTVINFLKEHNEVKLVKFILYTESEYKVFEKALKGLWSKNY